MTASTTDQTSQHGDQVRGLPSPRVPLSLIMDLAQPAGPQSREILDSEGRPETAWWVAP